MEGFAVFLLLVMTVLVWLIYRTVDGFNEDLKQLRVLISHIERHLADNLGRDNRNNTDLQ